MNIPQFYAKYTLAYYNVMKKLLAYKKLLELNLKYLPSEGKVLDSGCGPGNLCLQLLKHKTHVFCIDKNETALSFLKENTTNYKNKVSIINHDVTTALPFDDDYFDGIASMLVLPFIQNVESYLKDHYRVLKKSGKLVISAPDARAKDVDSMLKDWKKELEKNKNFTKLESDWDIFCKFTTESATKNVINWMSSKEIKILLKKSGFGILKDLPNPLYYGKGYVIVAEKR